MGNVPVKRIKVSTLVKSAPFKQGVKDYQNGCWTEYMGNWKGWAAGDFYEQGRLTACAANVPRGQHAKIDDWIKARDCGAFPGI